MAMHKRKRSDSELSFSSSTTLSSPSRPATTFNFSSLIAADTESYASAMFCGFRAPSHLNSRTMKRTRNGRPSEAEVHERTLGLLYAAQDSAHHQPATPEEHMGQYGGEDDRDGETPPPPLAPQSTEDCTPPNQRSLYSFWTIARPAQRKPEAPVAPAGSSHADDDHCMSDDM